jgi:uncharacterized membrane protein YfcA
MTALLLAALCGAVAGGIAGLLGIGGGAIIPPLLGLMLGVGQHEAQGISLAALLPPVGLPAVLAYRRSGVRIDVGVVGSLIAGFLGGGPAGAWLAHRLPERALAWLFAAFLLLLAVRTLREEQEGLGSAPEPPRSRALAVAIALGVGFVAGGASGLLGVGGGIVVIPSLVRLLRYRRIQAQATSLAMLLPPIGAPAVIVYAKEQGGLPWGLMAAVAVGFALAAGLGARVATKLSPKASTRLFAGLLLSLALALAARR